MYTRKWTSYFYWQNTKLSNYGQKMKKKRKIWPKMKKMRCHEKMKKKKNKNGSGQAAFIKN